MSGFAIPPQPGPMPLTTGKILDHIWVLLKANWKLYVALGSVPMGAMVLMEAGVFGVLFAAGAFPPQAGTTPMPPEMVRRMVWIIGPLVLLLDLVFLAVYALFQGATCFTALEANRGGATTFSRAWGQAWGRLGRYAWLGFVKALCLGAPMVLCFLIIGIISAVFAVSKHGGLGQDGVFVLISIFLVAFLATPVYGIWMALKLALAFPACVHEDIPGWESMKRSNFLTQHAKGRIFLVMLVVYALTYAAMFALEMVGFLLLSVGSLVAMALHLQWNSFLAIAGITIGGLAVLAAFVALFGLSMSSVAVALSVIYDDQRARLEPQGEPA
jgi:hypothetical protein